MRWSALAGMQPMRVGRLNLCFGRILQPSELDVSSEHAYRQLEESSERLRSGPLLGDLPRALGAVPQLREHLNDPGLLLGLSPLRGERRHRTGLQ